MENRKFKAPYKRQFVSSKQYNHFKTVGAAPLPQFPSTLLAPYYIDIQSAENCSAFSAVDERYGVTGKRYDPNAQWQSEISFLKLKDPSKGVTIDQKMQVGVKVGFTPVGANIPTDAAKCYFWVTQVSGFDWFDSVRLAIFQLYQKYGKVIPVTIGVNWYSEWDNTPNGILLDNAKTLLGGHDIEIAGFELFETPTVTSDWYMHLPGTWGTGYGDRGVFRVNRAVFNKYFIGFGAAYWLDDANAVPAKLNLLVTLLQNLVILYQRLIAQKSSFPPPQVTPAPVPPTPAAPAAPIYFWDTVANAEHSVRLICDEEGLTYNMRYGNASTKNILLACIQLESAFMNYRPDGTPMKHINYGMNGVVSSTDWGICQINDYFHIGEGKDFPSVDYVLANPATCVRWMAKLFMAGKADLWSSYTGGGYKKYL